MGAVLIGIVIAILLIGFIVLWSKHESDILTFFTEVMS